MLCPIAAQTAKAYGVDPLTRDYGFPRESNRDSTVTAKAHERRKLVCDIPIKFAMLSVQYSIATS